METFEIHIEKVFYLQAMAKVPALNEQDAKNIVELANTNGTLEELGFDFESDIEPIEADDDNAAKLYDNPGITVNLNIISVEPAAQEAVAQGGK